MSPEPRNPKVAAVVSRRPAPALANDHRRAELRRRQGQQPLDADQHRPGPALHAGQPHGRRPQAVPQLRHLHRQRLERLLGLPRAQRQARRIMAAGCSPPSPTPGRRAPTASLGRRRHRGNESTGWQGFLNNHDPGLDHGLLRIRRGPSRWSASFVWNLPFGKGERFGGNASGVKNAIIGGWQVNGIYIWQRGFPITIRPPTSGTSSTASARTGRTSPAIHRAAGEDRAVVQHRGVRPAGPRPVRQLRAQHPARARHQQPGSRVVQELRPREGCAPAVPVRVVQRVQPPEFHRRGHEHHGPRHFGASRRPGTAGSSSSG